MMIGIILQYVALNEEYLCKQRNVTLAAIAETFIVVQHVSYAEQQP